MQAELFKKVSNYEDKDGNKKIAINFYLKLGNEFVPIEVRYFEDKKFDGKDPNYRGRRLLLSAMAEEFPPKDSETTESEQ